MSVALVLGIFVVFYQPRCRVDLRCGGCAGSCGSGSFGSLCLEKSKAGRREQVKAMVPKNACGNRLKPGSSEQRLPQTLPLGLVSKTANVGKKMAPKIQGGLENKQPAPALDSDSGTEVKSAGHHGGGPTIPEMFKNPQSAIYPLPLARRLTMATSFKQSPELGECGDFCEQ
ncbi:hypothetical protein NDU88_007103 [Pleurodeles waltl]|uniref:Uncharacterized protein n=1 Tax=Pleurodeles waltl TaxID=8319 RepID=A0AAV7NU04_PLEWA|nr:hypothetical protein NDU88_007103 [Pleurodeles waltl]